MGRMPAAGMTNRVTALEEGLFGITRVKLGDDAKEHGVLLRSLGKFRRFLFAALAIVAMALVGLWIFGRRATRASVARVECRSIIEGFLLKYDEIDELARRLRQREILDRFLRAENHYEKEFKRRVEKLFKRHSVAEDLERAFNDEMKTFVDSVGDAIERIISPMDSAFKYIPARIKTLQVEIKQELNAFAPAAGACGDLTQRVEDVHLKNIFLKKMARLAELGLNASTLKLDQADAALWASMHQQAALVEVPAALNDSLLRLLHWYTNQDPDALADILVPANLSPDADVSNQTQKFIEEDDRVNDEDEDDDDDDDDNADDKRDSDSDDDQRAKEDRDEHHQEDVDSAEARQN